MRRTPPTAADLEDGAQGREPRNKGGFWKLVKARKEPNPADIPVLAKQDPCTVSDLVGF